jgi:3-deoxy-D-manno-octulosonic-acid transferase
MASARTRSMTGLIPSSNMRGLLRTLKNNDGIWYAPDQDFGLQSSVFAPFMGVPAATLTLTTRIVKASHASVLPYYSERLPDNKGYLLRIGAALENFPSGDDVIDATRINQAIEVQVRRTPEQYLWGHRRFKTRPRGEPQFYPARRDKTLRTYSRFLALISLPAIIYTSITAWRNHNLKYLKQRIGFGSFPDKGVDILVHAASVGEVNAVLPLLNLIHKTHPDKKLLLTVNTPSGYNIATSKLPSEIECHFLPIDWMFAVKRFIRRVKPKSILIVETEIWPNLYLFAHYLGIPIIIINGRLSEKSTQARPVIRRILSRSLEAVYAVYARSELDANRFIEMSFKAEYLKTPGNLKFASKNKKITEVFNCSRPYVLAASTRPGEERLITEAWLKLKLDQELLIIVPRHPKRLGTILSDLNKFNIKTTVRSRKEDITDQTQVYIADTFGELEQFIAGSLFVVMGGSINNYGGQNILEVAQAEKAVLFGPSMNNFLDECHLFIENEAGIQFLNNSQLFETMEHFLNEPEIREQYAANARELISKMEGITQHYLTELETDLPVFNSNHPTDTH